MINRLKDKSPEAALIWLAQADVIRALGSKRIAELLRHYRSVIHRAQSSACSAPIADAVANGLIRTVSVPGMVRARGRVRWGEGIPARRWTPQIAVELEDRYDLMATYEATICADPPSPTGVLFQQIALRGKRVRFQETRLASRSEARRLRAQMIHADSNKGLATA